MPKLDLSRVPVKTGSIYPGPYAAMMAGRSSLRLGDAGGLTQFGVNLVMLEPGALSSLRHWHMAEDEFVLALSGSCTLCMDDGQYPMQPHEAAAFPAGRADGHNFVNHGRTPASFLVAGTKAAREVATYSDVDLKIEIAGGKAVFTRKDGTPFAATPADGHLPAHRRHGLPAGLIRSPAWQDEADPVHPILGGGAGPYRYMLLSDPGGLSQFGAFLEELPPGSRSGHRHWHEAEDEFVYILSGQGVLVEDVETPVTAGDALAWPAGLAVGHRIDNRSDAPLRYLVLGTRGQTDRIHYSDHDLVTEKNGQARRYLRRDGSLIKEMP